MKKIIAIVLVCLFVFTGCAPKNIEQTAEQVTEPEPTVEIEPTPTPIPETPSPVIEQSVEDPSAVADIEITVPSFTDLGSPEALAYVEETVYTTLVTELNSDYYFVESVNAVYVSQEYLDELAFNSKSNMYFGYTLDELEEQFNGERFIFTLGDDGTTVAREFSPYDDTYDKIVRNAAIGTGVILVCVVITVVSKAAGATAFSAVFAASAKAGSIAAVADGLISGVTTGVITNMETGNKEQALKEGALSASEGFKWGAIIGSITGGAEKAIALKGATKGGLTMNQVAKIQQESKYPLDVIKQFQTMEQYEICKNAGLVPKVINGKTALIRNIDLDYVDEFGKTNLQRMQAGEAALDATGLPYEIHHVGQKVDSTFAILSRSEHRQGGNHKIWHYVGGATDNPSSQKEWAIIKSDFWKSIAKILGDKK